MKKTEKKHNNTKSGKKKINEQIKKKDDDASNFKVKLLNCCSNVKDKIVDKAKEITKKDILVFLVIVAVIAISALVFFEFTLAIFPDGSSYFLMSKCLSGVRDFTWWSAVRGFSFPLLLLIFTTLFGDSITGVLIGLYIFYLLSILFLALIVKQMLKENNYSKNKIKYWLIFISLLVFNPLMIGYGHAMLTEAVTPALYALTIFLCFKWYRMSFRDNKKSTIFMNIGFMILGTFIWFIKQPYAPAFFIAIGLTAIFSAIFFKSKKVLLEKLGTVLICGIFLIISIVSWNKFLEKNANRSSSESDSSFLANGLIDGVGFHYRKIPEEKFCNDGYLSEVDIDKSAKEKILSIKKNNENWCSHVKFYDLVNENNDLIDNMVIISDDANFSTADSLKFLLSEFFKNPKYILNSYFHNFLAFVDIEPTTFDSVYYSSGEVSSSVSRENDSIGMYVFTSGRPVHWWSSYEESQLLEAHLVQISVLTNYEDYTDGNQTLSEIIKIKYSFIYYLFKVLLLFSLPIFIYSVVRFFISKNINYFVTSLLSGVTFGHLAFHTIMGAIIDRYAYVVFPLMLVCLIILMMEKNIEKKEVK